jgi:hypothetical protein
LKHPIIRVVSDRRFVRGTPAKILLILVIVNAIVFWRQAALERKRRENLLTNVETEPSPVGARFDRSVGEKLEKFIPAIPDARRQNLVLLVGMSQMYAINQYHSGDRVIAEVMDDELSPQGTRVFGLAAPNLSNEEALFLLVAMSSDSATRPNVFLFGACFDKMRNMDLREGYQRVLRNNSAVQHDIAELSSRYADRFPLAAAKLKSTLTSATTAANLAVDSTFEMRLRDRVSRAVPLVKARRDINSFILYDVLYTARNKLFHITTTTKRPMLPDRYETNKQFLMMMIEEAKRRNIKFATYIVPLNPQSANPYVPEEYAQFKVWAEQTAKTYGVPFSNLENAVPAEDWGLTVGGPDFKHFKGAGHVRTAEAIIDHFRSVLTGTRESSVASK